MADPRFYDNRGPFSLDALCAQMEIPRPEGADGAAEIFDIAGLREAGPQHLSYYDSPRARDDFAATKAGWCLTGAKVNLAQIPQSTVLIACASAGRAFATAARLFYPEHELDIRAQESAIHPSAKLGEGVVLAPGVVIGPGAEIGDGARIGANAVIGRGVAIGRGCQIGARAAIAFAYLGDEVVIQPGAVIGGSGFGFTSGLEKIPQLGRAIVQDRVELGANSTVDRGAFGDTVIGEGSKIDNLVQIGHNTRIGRYCVLVAQSGVSGSVLVGDGVVIGGGVGIADHLTIGDGVRLAAKTGVSRDLEAGKAYGGIPEKPIRQWWREVATLERLAKRSKRTTDE